MIVERVHGRQKSGADSVMAQRIFQIKELPDLSLSKYEGYGTRGIQDILAYHTQFLKQIHGIGVIFNISTHLYYLQNPDSGGLSLFVSFIGTPESLCNIDVVLQTAQLNVFFDFCEISDFSFFEEIPFSYCTVLMKNEKKHYFPDEVISSVSEWESNENSRLITLIQLIGNVKEPCLYRLDLYPYGTYLSEELSKQMQEPLGVLNARLSESFHSGQSGQYRDVIQAFETLLSSLSESLYFSANIFAFSNNTDLNRLILDAASSECIISGMICTPSFYLNGGFSAFSFLDEDSFAVDLYDDSNKYKLFSRDGRIMCVSEGLIHLEKLQTLFSVDEISPFFRLPLLNSEEEAEIPKETSPLLNKVGIPLGKNRNGRMVLFPYDNLVKHAFISGVPGSGKTNFMLHLASQLWAGNPECKIPFLILEPAKQEYRALLNLESMKDVRFFSPNAQMNFPLHINPFEMPEGMIVSEHIRRLGEVFSGAFPLTGSTPTLLDTAIQNIYFAHGWSPYEKFETRQNEKSFPTMSELYDELKTVIISRPASDDVKRDMLSFLENQIGTLLKREVGIVFNCAFSTVKPEEWIRIPAIIELEAMGSEPSNFISLVLLNLIRETLKLRGKGSDSVARHVLFIEEAHNLIGNDSSTVMPEYASAKNAATQYIVKMLAEVRALNEGIIIADQLPTAMPSEIIKNTSLKIGLRMTAYDDREVLGGTMSATLPQLEEMGKFTPGEALLSYEGLPRPFVVQTTKWCDEESIYAKGEKLDNSFRSPKPDDLLIENIIDRPVYLDTYSRSVQIEKRFFAGEVKRILAKYEEKMADIRNFVGESEDAKKIVIGKLLQFSKEAQLEIDSITLLASRIDSTIERWSSLEKYLCLHGQTIDQIRESIDETNKYMADLRGIQKKYEDKIEYIDKHM